MIVDNKAVSHVSKAVFKCPNSICDIQKEVVNLGNWKAITEVVMVGRNEYVSRLIWQASVIGL
jgi:hypothetical protein